MKKFIQYLFAIPRDLEKKYHRVSSNMFFSVIGAFAIHLLFIFIFLQLDVYFMVVYNIGSCIFFLALFLLVKKGFVLFPFTAMFFEIVLHDFLAVYFIGWESGFHYYIILLCISSIFPCKNLGKFIFSGIAIAAYLLINVFSQIIPPLYIISPIVLTVIRYMNILYLGSFLSLIGFYYSNAADKAETALEEEKKKEEKFFANISHEFRTPLTMLLAPVESIKQGEYGETLKKNNPVFDTILNNGIRLLKLINNLLDFTKLEAGRMSLKLQKTDLPKILNFYISTVKSAAESKGLHIIFNDNTDGLESDVDRDLLEKAVFNLISNAFKFTPPGGDIILQLDELDESIKISVKDNGIGIPEDKLESIFDRFKQVDDSVPRKYEGTGIGLSFVKEIVDLHSGEIVVKSTEGNGSAFTITLPKKQTDSSVAEEIDTVKDYLLSDIKTPTVESTEENRESEEIREKEHTVLVMEDTEDMRKYIKEMLEKDYNVITAGNGRIGLEKVKEDHPDLVLSDVMMPEADGYEVTRTIKSDPELKGIPVILLTAKADVLMKIEGLEYGADDYISKPFNVKELRARIRSQLKMKQLRDEVSKQRDFLQTEVERQMKELLNSEKLKKYLPARVVDELLKSGEPDTIKRKSERKKLTIFFSDIKDFTSTTDHMEPEELSWMLNDYLSEMSKIAQKLGGTIDKFIGDAVLVYFGGFDSRDENENAKDCISMAIEMQEKMEILKQKWKKKGIVYPFQIRAGINAGYCTIGNFGSEERLDYTIIGGEVNLAARLETAAVPGKIMVSESVKFLTEDKFKFKNMEPIDVKGFDHPVKCFEVKV